MPAFFFFGQGILKEIHNTPTDSSSLREDPTTTMRKTMCQMLHQQDQTQNSTKNKYKIIKIIQPITDTSFKPVIINVIYQYQ